MKITELLSSGDAVNALESAIRALPGGHDAMEAAIAATQTQPEPEA